MFIPPLAKWLLIPMVTWLIALFIFATMRNKAAKRNDSHRTRLWTREENTLKVLRSRAKQKDNI